MAERCNRTAGLVLGIGVLCVRHASAPVGGRNEKVNEYDVRAL